MYTARARAIDPRNTRDSGRFSRRYDENQKAGSAYRLYVPGLGRREVNEDKRSRVVSRRSIHKRTVYEYVYCRTNRFERLQVNVAGLNAVVMIMLYIVTLKSSKSHLMMNGHYYF